MSVVLAAVSNFGFLFVKICIWFCIELDMRFTQVWCHSKVISVSAWCIYALSSLWTLWWPLATSSGFKLYLQRYSKPGRMRELCCGLLKRCVSNTKHVQCMHHSFMHDNLYMCMSATSNNEVCHTGIGLSISDSPQLVAMYILITSATSA